MSEKIALVGFTADEIENFNHKERVEQLPSANEGRISFLNYPDAAEYVEAMRNIRMALPFVAEIPEDYSGHQFGVTRDELVQIAARAQVKIVVHKHDGYYLLSWNSERELVEELGNLAGLFD